MNTTGPLATAPAIPLPRHLERYVAGEPIRARPVGRLERARKWVRRRPAVAPTAHAFLAELSEALNRGWGERDSRSPMVIQQERAGIEVRVDAKRIAEALERDPPG